MNGQSEVIHIVHVEMCSVLYKMSYVGCQDPACSMDGDIRRTQGTDVCHRNNDDNVELKKPITTSHHLPFQVIFLDLVSSVKGVMSFRHSNYCGFFYEQRS